MLIAWKHGCNHTTWKTLRCGITLKTEQINALIITTKSNIHLISTTMHLILWFISSVTITECRHRKTDVQAAIELSTGWAKAHNNSNCVQIRQRFVYALLHIPVGKIKSFSFILFPAVLVNRSSQITKVTNWLCKGLSIPSEIFQREPNATRH